jgi:hypothetical protein
MSLTQQARKELTNELHEVEQALDTLNNTKPQQFDKKAQALYTKSQINLQALESYLMELLKCQN